MQAEVAVLWGANGIFCAGANLKAISEGHGNKIEKDGDDPIRQRLRNSLETHLVREKRVRLIDLLLF